MRHRSPNHSVSRPAGVSARCETVNLTNGGVFEWRDSRTASWLTGQTIALDGGLTLTGGV